MTNTAILDLIAHAKDELRPLWRSYDHLKLINQRKVLTAFHDNRVSDYHLVGTTGYGYGDLGRDAVEGVFAHVFRGEEALVRPNLVSGTHAISACLFGSLQPGDELVSAVGKPYDTLCQVIGIEGNAPGNLMDMGVVYREVPLTKEGKPDRAALERTITKKTRVVLIQRSRGYAWRAALRVSQIEAIVNTVKNVRQDIICFVDNCYGEFVEEHEPLEAGADLIAGSLIKNPGGTLAPSGGYIVGKGEYMERIAARVTAPAIGARVGPMLNLTPLILQGLFLAPHTVGEVLQGLSLVAKVFADLGFPTEPFWQDPRGDAVQAIRLGSADRLIAFCRGIQKAGPVDGYVTPEPSGMPGYEDQIIMAGGTFVQGSSSELSADGPLRPPYTAYLQGGMSKEHIELGLVFAFRELLDQGLIRI
ncbi:MAG: hypothetical protein GX980_10240 [Firmicutes bacterium]|nr:hypothetical protein [Bacillota bacterium]